MSLFKNRTVVGVICILLSLVICFGVTPLFNKSVSQKEQIIRVTQPILAGEEITADMVQAVEVGGYNLPENVIRLKENVVGKFATADLAAGDYIINTKVSDEPAADTPTCTIWMEASRPCPSPSKVLLLVCPASCRAEILFP